ncbi:glycosyltransferase family 2 protein [Rhizobium leguminosarum]|uniref:glycosyltransferase family 2 protein n=1 Tax=Rhizobium leguminosarum TaxID=384 RepID=UPI001030EA3D|nr:glycosyltransferase family 2 protein [Rhizobium leguminosarum]TAZ00293.1 glycosyltransferase family 2 protein [Rhizobium leguminosarum]TAZ11158.1 glycosyltransferase family 2 protein [Rhizobium leguminosarum]
MTLSASVASISHYAKARFRRSLKAKQVHYDLMRGGLKQARHVVICVIRDEVHRLAFFLQYYRDLGIEHFICIDNGSTDGTAELLSSFEDVSLVSAHGSYKAARFGNDWINEVINRHCQEKWVLYVDADEFLVYPHCDTRPIDQLTAYIDSVGGRSLRAVMVDMYSPHPVLENVCEPGRNPLEVCNLFDRSGYVSYFDRRSRTIWIKGGVRGRVYFKERLWDGPALNKIPLVYVGGERLFLRSSHQVWPLSLNLGDMRGALGVSGALLHFKFLSTFVHKVADAAHRSQHTEEYTVYSSAEDMEDFVYDDTGTYRSWKDLSDHGLIQGEGWKYWKNASESEV